jgi:glycosyltransferase involved in cell wall biosynthesis
VASTPLLSIGLFVYNGERFIRKALDSLIGQTFRDFELIISDNASTDRTADICLEYAARDPRIRFFQAQKNMGAGWNVRRVYFLATGKYFKWAACDDFCEPSFLEKCVEALERDRSVVVAHSKTRVVDEEGRVVEEYEWPMATNSPHALTRFRDLLLNDHLCFQIFGVMRMDALKKLPPQGSYVNSDGVLLAQLGLLGKFYEVPERLFISTRHSGQSTRTLPVRVKVKKRRFRLTNRHGTLPSPEWWDPTQTKAITFPEWRQLREYFLSVWNAPLGVGERLGGVLLLIPWIAKHFRRMMKDLLIAADQVLYNLQMARVTAGELTTAEEKSA